MILSEPVESCPVCGNRYVSRIAHRDRYAIEASFSLCLRCGFIYLNPRPSQEAYTEFYEREYRKLVEEYRGPKDLERNQWHYGFALAKFLADQNILAESVLDIGGSTGIIASHVAGNKKGCKVTVVDPCAEELKQAQSKGFRVLTSTAEEVRIKGIPHELILMCRTIDHIREPKRVLQDIVSEMSKSDVLYLDHCDWLFVARREGFTNSLHVDHPSNFTRESINRLFEQVGLVPFAEYRPPKSTCYGYLLKRGEHKYLVRENADTLSEIRRMQSRELDN